MMKMPMNILPGRVGISFASTGILQKRAVFLRFRGYSPETRGYLPCFRGYSPETRGYFLRFRGYSPKTQVSTSLPWQLSNL